MTSISSVNQIKSSIIQTLLPGRKEEQNQIKKLPFSPTQLTLQSKFMSSRDSTRSLSKQLSRTDLSFALNKINKKLDLLCLGEFNCHYTHFLMEYTGQTKDDNQIQNVYVKKIKDKVVFFHQWKELDDMEVMQPFDGLVFFVDLVHHLNNTTQTVLKHLQTLSALSGMNVFRIPITLIALNGSSLKQKQFQYEKHRLEKRLNCILQQKQILYYSSGIKQNFTMISEKLQRFVDRIFENDPQSIKSSWTAYWKLYGIGQALNPYWTEILVLALGWKERILAKNDQKDCREENETVRPFLKKLW